MEFRLLGPFEASHESRAVPVGRRQERLLLAALLLAAPAPVGTDRLIGLLWPQTRPARARATLHTYVGRLRHVLAITRAGDGYRVAGEHRLDVTDFRRLAGTASTDPAERMRCYREALALWRGEFLAGLDTSLGADLTALRLTTAERYARLCLESGTPADELPELARSHPTRERLAAYTMTQLHRDGRRAEALELFARVSRALAELDVSPGPELSTLRARIEADDPALHRPPAPVYAVRVRDQWLPWQTAGHPALEFCNTYAGWGRPPEPRSDWLRDYPALAVWAGHVDLADEWVVTRLLAAAARDPRAAAEVLTEARELRKHLYVCFTDPEDRVAFKAVAAAAEAAARSATFVRGEDGLGYWRISPAAGLRLPVLAAARSAAELLADPRRFTVRACPGEECGWLFLNEQGRRRWCSLATCGSRCTGPAIRF